MVTRTRLRTIFFQLALWMVSAALVGYFIYHAVHGERGLAARKTFEAELASLRAELKTVEGQRADIEARVSQLRPDSVDKDLLEELAREQLGWLDKKDRILVQK